MGNEIWLLISATALLLGSPGPAPMALALTSASFGVKRSLPFLVGILAGLLFVIAGAALGLSALLSAFPTAGLILQLCGAAYIVYVAYKIASAPVGQCKNSASLPSLFDGFMLNLLNPKAYAAFLALYSQFLLPASNPFTAYLLTGLVCFAVALVVDTGWVLLGGLLSRAFSSPAFARPLRISFSVAMLGAVAWALLPSIMEYY